MLPNSEQHNITHKIMGIIKINKMVVLGTMNVSTSGGTTPSEPKSGPLCFTAEEDGSSVSLVFEDNGIPDPTPPQLKYSLNDTEHWTEYEMNQVIPLAKDAKVFFKANGKNERISAPSDEIYPTMIYRFVMEGKIAASGNI